MREQQEKRRRSTAELDILIRWLNRVILAAMDWGSSLDTVNYFYRYDRRTRSYQYYISPQEVAYNITIISISAIAFGAGIVQCVNNFEG